MEQKKCSQCKNLIPLRAPTCLYCGRPNKFVTKNYVNKKWAKTYYKKNKNNNKKITYYFICFLLFIIFIIFLLSLYN